MEKITNQFSSIEQVTSQYLNNKTVNNTSQSTDVSFEDVLRQTALERETGLKFSKHASMRLNERDIILTQNQSTRLENGVDAASKKGINDSLVLVDNLAFIVNVPSNIIPTVGTITIDPVNINSQNILVQNKNFKSFISIDQFKNDFNNHPFYFIEFKTKDEEIDQTHIVWRQ